MRIVIMVFVMGAITVTVAAMVLAELLMAMLPVLAVVVAAFALARLMQRRWGTGSTARVPMRRANQPIVVPPARFGHQAAGFGGWVIVPIAMVSMPAPQPVVMDGYLLGGHGRRHG